MNTSDRAILDGIRGSLTREVGRVSYLSHLLYGDNKLQRASYRLDEVKKLVKIRNQVDVLIRNSTELPVSYSE